jgi:hypothetical protein
MVNKVLLLHFSPNQVQILMLQGAEKVSMSPD